jgi:hypothetical protein
MPTESSAPLHTAHAERTAAFIARWSAASGSELANAQSFVRELCALLDVPVPDPARAETADNAYVFERRIIFRHGSGSTSEGRIDCYRRGAFVLEAKKIKVGGAQTFDDALMRARGQAEGYARALPAEEGRPPFLVVVDVGNVIELYAEFSRSGATYTPFPDPRSHRIALADLHQPEIRERLRLLWLDPLALDPTGNPRASPARSPHISPMSPSHWKQVRGHAPEAVAGFLTRCLFSMFAEDVALIPKGSFSQLLDSLKDNPAQLVPLVGELWRAMDKGEFSVAIRAALPRFNGKLFKQPDVLPLTKPQIALLLEASKADWTQVEPAIFGTLLERALDPPSATRSGAHYTPRAYVERLVLPTVIEPLRTAWKNVQAAALLLATEGKRKEAIAELRTFHHNLCNLRVLDPACGSGNFLYVTLEHMKRLEGEVLNQLHEFGHSQAQLETEGFAVDPHQFLGLELNPRAAAIAELVLWIGYLQWHFRTNGSGLPSSPILKDFRNIECRDAVLAYDAVEYVTDERGVPVSRWDGRTMKKHPVTGADVPDESAQVPLERYLNPRRAEWPTADVIVGNPPFIGNKRMRVALGDGYVEALRRVWNDVPESADFVMFWWHQAAQLVAQGKLSRFGFITTNSLTQASSRRIVQAALDDGLHLSFAIPDHPWVDSADGADVRIAMTVAAPGSGEGKLCNVTAEREGKSEGLDVELAEREGLIHADLTIGANVSSAQTLRANLGLCYQGMNLVGKGFRLTPEEVVSLGYAIDQLPPEIKPHRNARDMMQGGETCFVIDLFGYTADEARAHHPALYQRLLDRVKPERDQNNRESRRRNWWLFGEPVGKLRKAWATLPRLILTPETSKHRVFAFQNMPFCPDHKLYAVCSADAWVLGVLSSRPHAHWALAAGGKLGVGNDPTWTNTTCFLTFPFPVANAAQQARIRDLAEQIDAHRKRVLAQHDELTLTGLYNVLEKLRSNAPLNAKEKSAHERGLVAVLKSLHDELDAAVLDAYGWNDLACPSTGSGRTGEGVMQSERDFDDVLLERLVALNAERAAEEAAGTVRWLRPEFQNPNAGQPTTTSGRTEDLGLETTAPAPAATDGKQPWPSTLPEQIAALAQLLDTSNTPLSLDDVAARFATKGAWRKRLPQLLDTLAAVGRARQTGEGWSGV